MVESQEQWKDIIDYPGYRISSFGRVYNTQTMKYSNGSVNKNDNYVRVGLRKDGKQKFFYMHRIVAKYFLEDFNENLEVDHIDRIKTNNNIINLRMATRQQNQLNQTKQKNTTSMYLGVCLKQGKWMASIFINGKKKYLGTFEKEKDAAIAYNQEKVKLGPHVNLNIISDDEDEDDNQQE